MSHSPPPPSPSPSPSPPPPQDPLPMVVDPSSPVGSGDPWSQYIFAFPSPPRPFDSYLVCSPILLVGEMPLSPLWIFDDERMGPTAQTIDSGARSSSYGEISLDTEIFLDSEISLVDSEIPFDWKLVSLRRILNLVMVDLIKLAFMDIGHGCIGTEIDIFMWKWHCGSPGYTNLEIDIFMWKWHCGSPGYTNLISTCELVVFHMPPRANTGNIGDFIDLAAFKTVRRMYWIMNEGQKTTDAQMIQLKMPRLQYLGFLINRSPARRTPGPRIVFRCLLRFALSLLLLQYSAEQQKLRDVLKRHFTGESSNADSKLFNIIPQQPRTMQQQQQNQEQLPKYGSILARMDRGRIANIATVTTQLIQKRMALLVSGDTLGMPTRLAKPHLLKMRNQESTPAVLVL